MSAAMSVSPTGISVKTGEHGNEIDTGTGTIDGKNIEKHEEKYEGKHEGKNTGIIGKETGATMQMTGKDTTMKAEDFANRHSSFRDNFAGVCGKRLNER